MSKDVSSSRRSFLKGGAIVAAPLAVAASAAAMAQEPQAARLARLEDEAAIQKLHQAWLRGVNTGADEDVARLFADPRRASLEAAVRGVAPDHAADPDRVEIAWDGLSASGRFHCAVEVETAIAPDCTAAQMARLQGGGLVRRTEPRLLKADYVKAGGAWAIARLELV
jgi:hypothetical protein